MKILAALCVLTFVTLSFAESEEHPRGCIIKLRECVRECEEGTRAYNPGCGPWTPEATCEEPNPREARKIICDFSECYCEPPTVRDKASGKCVTLDQCPGK